MERLKQLHHDPSPARQAAVDFLLSHLPESDLACYDASLFLQFADHALALRESAAWCAAADEEIFYQYVLFPRVNDEDLSFHREIFRAALWDRVANLPTIEEKILEVNRWCCENASYRMQDDRTASPLTVYRCGSGRCGEESAFLVSALRSVGIPARQVYSPRWAHCDDNHAWVEALCGSEWKFLGACEPEPVLNRGWFNAPASRALLVHSRVFGAASHPLHGERIGADGCVTWMNQTSRYAITRPVTLRAERNGQRAGGTEFQIQVLNEAGFHTIATLTADENGEASIRLGLGDFHIFAQFCGYFSERDCRGEDALTLSLHPRSDEDTDWQTADYLAPLDAPVNPSPLSGEQKRSRAAVLASSREKRETRIAAMAADGEEFAADLLTAARGNAGEIRAFLQQDNAPLRERMLRTLTEKDLRDAAAKTLDSHFRYLPAHAGEWDEERFAALCSPRIELEPLTPWRETLRSVFSPREQEQYRADPAALWGELLRRITADESDGYANLVTTPYEAWTAGKCSERSRRILYVALLRTLGIPARLRSPDGAPEFALHGAWHTPADPPCAVLTLSGCSQAAYGQGWTLSRREKDGWKLLRITAPEDSAPLSLPEGYYRLMTSVRMPNGNQFAARRDFPLKSGEDREIALLFRGYALEDLLRATRLPNMSAETPEGQTVPDICRTDGRPSLLLWPEEGGEPTEHILLELADARDQLAALPMNIIFLLRSREGLRQSTLASVLRKMPFVRVLLDDWDFDLEQTARCLTCDPDTPPLAVLCDRAGNAVYGISGYRVGSVELLQRIGEYLTKTP